MVVIDAGCALFLTSHCDVKFTFHVQRFGEFFCQNSHQHTYPLYSLLYDLICYCIGFKSSALQLKMQIQDTLNATTKQLYLQKYHIAR